MQQKRTHNSQGHVNYESCLSGTDMRVVSCYYRATELCRKDDSVNEALDFNTGNHFLFQVSNEQSTLFSFSHDHDLTLTLTWRWLFAFNFNKVVFVTKPIQTLFILMVKQITVIPIFFFFFLCNCFEEHWQIMFLCHFDIGI